ncbi:MAG: NAD(P)/FAD-dependent oxidoreductase [Bdellovibrio sp.]|nr:NAD(P)/FAD-dependent oxidoreductase [Bdellovibrio sp.]
MHIYDYIIIGSGLTGLTIAQRLSTETTNVLVLESLDDIGGLNRPVTFADQHINNGLRFFPATESGLKALDNLENQLGLKLVKSVSENNPETYEASGYKSFVGFGNHAPEFYDQFSYFLSAKQVELHLQPWQWVQLLKEKFQGTLLTKSFVTKLGFENLEAKNPNLTHVVVNGNKTYHGHNFIFTAPIKELTYILPDEIMNIRLKSKINKSTSWQAVCVDLFHPQETEMKENLFVLNGTTDDDLGPCIGKFITKDMSQWLSFIDHELAEETENVGLVLKKIKRQIKRAFPEVSEKIQKERIFVSSSISGAELKLSANLTYPHVENLWIGSATTNTSPNLLGSLQTAQLILASLGFDPQMAYVEKTDVAEKITQEASI